MAQQRLTNTQKIATLLVALGTERSAKILEHLEPEQMARIAREIAAMGSVPHQQKRAVLREFRALMQAEERRRMGFTFAERVLDQAVGEEKAQQILQTISMPTAPSGPPYLATVTPARAADLLAGEPPHIAAKLLLVLSFEQAALILEHLPADERGPVAQQLAHATPPSAEVQGHLERALRAKAARRNAEEHYDGAAALTELLAAPAPMPAPVAPQPMKAAAPVAAPTPDVSFDDLLTMELGEVQAVLRSVDNDTLCLALCGAEMLLRQRLLAAVPFTRRVIVQHRQKALKGTRLRDITAAQDAIARIAQELQAGAGESRLSITRELTHV